MSDTKPTKAECEAAHQRFLDRISDWDRCVFRRTRGTDEAPEFTVVPAEKKPPK